jgi:hypothetical protein
LQKAWCCDFYRARAFVRKVAFVICNQKYLIQNFETQDIASTSNILTVKPGFSFSSVVGLGGDSIRAWRFDNQNNPWWAAKAALDNGVSYGALICTFKLSHPTADCVFKDINDVVWDQYTIKSSSEPVKETILQSSGQFREFTMNSIKHGPLSLKRSHVMDFNIPDNLENVKKIHLQVMMRFPRSDVVNGILDISTPKQPSPLNFLFNQEKVVLSTPIEGLESGEVWVSPNIIDLFPSEIPRTIRLLIKAQGMDNVEMMTLDEKLDNCLLPTLVIIN